MELVIKKEYTLRSPESFENLPLLAVEGFGDLRSQPFSEEWVKRIYIPKKEGYQKRNWFERIHSQYLCDRSQDSASVYCSCLCVDVGYLYMVEKVFSKIFLSLSLIVVIDYG